jgi:aldose 1-epimerase
MSLTVPDKNQNFSDIVCGYDSIEKYSDSPYFGCLVGRFGNRIANGQFTVEGKTYQVATNNGPNHLHGGLKGFDKVEWDAIEKMTTNGPSLVLSYLSCDGEEGYPGNLSIEATYTLTHENQLKLEYAATTDQKTIVNLTHHSYFNLAGHDSGDILDHKVMINADTFTPINETFIPTGEIQSVENTPLDFRAPQKIGTRINSEDDQIKHALGYDHNWIIKPSDKSLNYCAKVLEEKSGRVMEVYSTAPGMQFYSGNFLDGSNVGKKATVYNYRNAFCMEPQHFPDSPNQPEFPSTELAPGETYKNTIIYKFSTYS